MKTNKSTKKLFIALATVLLVLPLVFVSLSSKKNVENAEDLPTTLTADCKNPVNLKSPDNPTYMVVVPHKTGLSKKDVSFDGAFKTAKVQGIQEINGSSVVSFTKKYTAPKVDKVGIRVSNVGQIRVAGTDFQIEDTYIKGVSVTNANVGDAISDAGNMFGSFASIASAINGGNPILMAFNGLAGIPKVLNFFNDLFGKAKADPTQEKLDKILKELDAISSKIDFDTDQLKTQLTRQQYEDYLNAFVAAHNNLSNTYYVTKIKPFGDFLVDLANKAGLSVTDLSQLDLSDATQTDKIKDFLNQSGNYSYMLVMRSDLSLLYNNTSSSTYNDKMVTDVLNYFDAIDGSNNPFISTVTKTDTFTIFNAYESILHDWNYQTFADRQGYNQMVLGEIGILSGPLHYAISWDIEENQEVIDDSNAAIAKLDPNDPNYATNKAILEGQITVATQNIAKDNTIEGSIGTKLDTTLQTYQDAKDKLADEQWNFNQTFPQDQDLTTLNVHNSTLPNGAAWSAQDNFDFATDVRGCSIAFEQIKVYGKVDTSRAGSYDVTYMTPDGSKTATATIVIGVPKPTPPTPGQDTIYVHDSTLNVGAEWFKWDNFDIAYDSDGNAYHTDQIAVTGDVYAMCPGTFKIVYTTPGGTSATATVTVVNPSESDDIQEPVAGGSVENYRTGQSYDRFVGQPINSTLGTYLNFNENQTVSKWDGYDGSDDTRHQWQNAFFYHAWLNGVKFDLNRGTDLSMTTNDYNTMCTQATLRGTTFADEVAGFAVSPLGNTAAYQLVIPDATTYNNLLFDGADPTGKERYWHTVDTLNFGLSLNTMTVTPNGASGKIQATRVGNIVFKTGTQMFGSYDGAYWDTNAAFQLVKAGHR